MLVLIGPLVNTRAFCSWSMRGKSLFGLNIAIFSSGIRHTFRINHVDVERVYCSYCEND